MTLITNGGSERVGDHPLAFGMRRYEDRSGASLWVWSATRYCGGEPYCKIPDVTLEDLRQMRKIIDRHIRDLESDGGRKSDDKQEDVYEKVHAVINRAKGAE